MPAKAAKPAAKAPAGKAKAEAKAKAQAKASDIAQKQNEESLAKCAAATRGASDDELQGSDDLEGPTKRRRQLSRRSSDEQVERAVAARLSHLPDEVWRTKVTKDGLSISEYVKRWTKKMHSDGKRLGTKFWTDLYNEFDLNESCADSLEDPPDDLKVNKDLLVALAAAQCGNPAGAPSAQLERFLDHCPQLNRAELYGLFRATMEGPAMPRNVAVKCHIATLRHLARIPGFNNSQDTGMCSNVCYLVCGGGRGSLMGPHFS
jgi:hypothetical protein